jgi:hypothetical protein
MIDALYPAGGFSLQAIVGDALLTNCPEGHPVWQTGIYKIPIQCRVKQYLPPTSWPRNCKTIHLLDGNEP